MGLVANLILSDRHSVDPALHRDRAVPVGFPMIMETLKLAALVGMISPFIIVGTGVVLGLTLAISQTMLGMVLGMIELFTGGDDDDD